MMKVKVIIFGILAFSPLLLFFSTSNIVLNNATIVENNIHELNLSFIYNYLIISNSYIFIMILTFVIYLIKKTNLPKHKKIKWAFWLIFGHGFVMPFFWYHNILKHNKS